MNFIRLFFLALLSILIISALPAQERKCGSTEHTQALMKNPEYRSNFQKRMAAFNKVAAQKTSKSRLNCSNITTIPIAIHFQSISSNDRNCLENLVNQQIASLNADFQGSNTDISNWTENTAALFPDIANGETCVNFCVATKNHPSGYGLSEGQMAITINQTSGDRINDWAGYLNIIVMDIGDNILGYSPLGGRGNGDGVVIAKFAFGGDGQCGDVSTSSTLDRGRTLTHEVGHWFLLDHIWGDGGCGVDDNVADTPNSDGPNYGCPNNGKTACNSVDMHMNYMDYTNDECMYMFSAGQSTRMENYIQANLQNVISKGVNACGPAAEPTCTDGIQNGDETGVDCGGSCDPCPEPTCTDGIQNGEETGVDCGGSCDPCTTTPTCDDGIQNGEETGVDCGAPGCNDCPIDCDDNPIYIFVKPDNFGSEITWTVNDKDGNTVAGGGPYEDYNQTPITTELCLPPGCYSFNIHDAFSDGICCTYGNGQYAVLDKNETVLVSGGQYGSSETKIFAIGGETCEDITNPEVCNDPKPTVVEYFNNITRVRINWQAVPEADHYSILYRIAGSNTWTRKNTSRTRKTLRNLRTGTEYEVRFRSSCPNGWTDYGPIYTFTTLNGRMAPEAAIIATKVSTENKIDFDRLYPNPASSRINLNYTLGFSGDVNITVYNILGEQVIQQKIYQEKGIQKMWLSTENLTVGTFILKINAKNQQIIRKFIKK